MTVRRWIAFLLAGLLGLSGATAGCDLLGTSSKHEPDAFYYADGRKIPLLRAEWWKVVQIPNRTETAVESVLREQSGVHLRLVLDAERGFYWLEAQGHQNIEPAVDQLAKKIPIRQSIPAYYRVEHGDTTHFVMTDEFRAQFKSTVSHAEIRDLNAAYGVEFAPIESEIDTIQAREYNEYTLRVTEESECNALEAANRYYENSRTKWASPNFFVNLRFAGEVDAPRSFGSDPRSE